MAEVPASSAPVAPGDVLAGKYRVERILGQGGMGVVVAARHLELDERVAVKFLLPEVTKIPEAAARFVREARAAVKIKSEHVARVIDVGRLENDAPYMVMEYLEGRDLAAVVHDGPLPIEDAVDYVIQACDAMAEAHGHGIVHRDLKPSNLFLMQRPDGDGSVKVLDFGISKMQGAELADASLTKTSTMMGSPYYMSPEQMRSARDVDARTDIWSLGTILFELLTGRPPFLGDTLPELLTKIMTDRPPSLVELRPDAPPELEAVVFRCLEKARDQRYPNVGELARALLPFAPRRSRYMVERVLRVTGSTGGLPASVFPKSASHRAAPKSRETPSIGGQTTTTWAETGPKPAPKRRRATAAILGGCAVVGLLAIAGASVLRGSREATSEPTVRSAAAVTDPVASSVASVKPAEPTPPAVTVAEEPAPVITPSAPAPSTAPPVAETPPPATRARPSRQTPVVRQPPVSEPPRQTTPKEPEPAPPPAEPKPRRNPLAIELK